MAKKNIIPSVGEAGTINMCKQCGQEPIHEDCGSFCSNSCMEAWEDDAFAAHNKPKKPRPKVYIEMSGGLIQFIMANRKDVDIVIADYDCEYRKGDSEEDDKLPIAADVEDGEEVPDTVNIWKYAPDQIHKTFADTDQFTPYESPTRISELKHNYVCDWIRRNNL